jgi:CubicO group peptidase (beta-lactamase class C family)
VQPPDALVDGLDRLVGGAQAEQRSPSVSAAVFRDGEVIWRRALGVADVERGEAATPEHAYRIGSITKTFTAVCILQLRDAMVLDLGDPLRTHLPEAPAGPTVADGLAHLSGLQREPPGEIWETLRPPSREELIGGLEDAERVLRPGEAWHYSNLAFGLLGEIVARRSETGYEHALRSRVLDPLGLRRTGFDPSGPRATGYFVDPFSDRVTVEHDLAAEGPTAAMGWLWSTVDDLARWADFLATGSDGVLARKSLDEMARVRTMADQATWTLGWGLGLELYRRGERIFVGHGGAMPGFLAGLCVHRPERTGAAVLLNTGARAEPETLALDLAEATLEAWPQSPEPWRPDEGAPGDVAPLLGRWWSEGSELALSWSDGRLRLEVVDGPVGRSVSWLVPEGDDRWRIVEGRELGELLRVVRDDDGTPVKLYVATYPVTRVPAAFAGDAPE